MIIIFFFLEEDKYNQGMLILFWAAISFGNAEWDKVIPPGMRWIYSFNHNESSQTKRFLSLLISTSSKGSGLPWECDL